MSFTIKGKIVSIGEVKDFDNGAKAIDYQVETTEQYNNLYSFDIYKSAEHVEHVENFIKYNKVGDEVEVEFNVRTNPYNGRHFTSLSSWKCNKVGATTEANTKANTFVVEDDSLPF